MKLELKHLAGYLPYELKIKTTFGWDTMQTLNDYCVNIDFEDAHYYDSLETTDFKPILRPLSDLTKEIDVNGEKFVPIDWICKNINKRFSYSDNRFMDYDDGKSKKVLHFYLSDIHLDSIEFYDVLKINEKLLKWHFDIYGLIDSGLAIDINTLNK